MLANEALDKSSSLFVLDLDRCLITEAIYDLFNTTLADCIESFDTEASDEARKKTEASGGSFDISAWLLNERGIEKQQYNQFLDNFIARACAAGQDLFLAPGAKELLEALRRNEIPHMIMTYGGVLNQTAKIKATQLDSIAYTVVESSHKARYVREWWDEGAREYSVRLQGSILRAFSVVLVDDKAAAFAQLPRSSARGYWVTQEQLLASQQGDVPENVTHISSLVEILPLEHLM